MRVKIKRLNSAFAGLRPVKLYLDLQLKEEFLTFQELLMNGPVCLQKLTYLIPLTFSKLNLVIY